MAKRRKKSRATKRDYKAEYQRRVQRALDQGYSRRVARGHARSKKTKKGEPRELGIKAAKFLGQKVGTEIDVRAGVDIQQLTRMDKRRVFGRVIKRQGGEEPAEYALRLEELARRKGAFNWQDEAAFIRDMRAAGYSAQEAYTLWFS